LTNGEGVDENIDPETDGGINRDDEPAPYPGITPLPPKAEGSANGKKNGEAAEYIAASALRSEFSRE